jgi:succinoglycan biosynthesis transport protein ExoP
MFRGPYLLRTVGILLVHRCWVCFSRPVSIGMVYVNFRESWSLVRGHWVSVIALAALGTMLAAGYLLITTPKYTARTELFVAVDGGSSTADLAQGSNYSQQQARNYSAVATRQIVLEPVIKALDLNTTPEDLSRQISASVPLNTSLISISVTDPSPEQAATIADAVATSLSNVVVKLVPNRRDGTSPVQLETVQAAAVPVTPSTPSSRLLLVFGALGGLVAGVAFVIIRERISAKVRSAEQIQNIHGATVLGSISYDRRTAGSPMLARRAGDSPRAEEFRQLRTNLRFLQTDAPHKAFVVTSSIPGEGKSTTSANLAATLAATGNSVCLIEADLRKPVLHSYLDLEGSVGLTTVMTNEATLEEALQPWGPDNLKVLLSGDLPPNPSELLGSSQAEALFRSITEKFDVTIFDCPPLLPVTDAALLAKSLGGAILVVGTGRVEVRELKKTVESLETAGANLLGVILNFVPVRTVGQYKQVYGRTDKSPKAAPEEQDVSAARSMS